MRRVKIEGTKAGYARLKTLDQLGDYGLILPPQATAPFNVVWDASTGMAAVCLGRTPIAHVDLSEAAPVMVIRDKYPREHDNVLARAFRNAASMTDQLAKLMKAEGTHKGGLFTTTFERFDVQMDRKRFTQAMLGAEILDPRLRLSNRETGGNIEITVTIGKSNHHIKFAGHRDIMQCKNAGSWSAYHPKESSFTHLLERGARLWDSKMNPERLAADIDTLPDLSGVDRLVIMKTFLRQNELGNLPQPDAVLKCGRLSMSGSNANHVGDMRFEGLRIFSQQDGTTLLDASNLCGLSDPQRIKTVYTDMSMMWKAQCLGLTAQDFPVFDPEVVVKMIEETDLGYDF